MVMIVLNGNIDTFILRCATEGLTSGFKPAAVDGLKQLSALVSEKHI